MQSELYIQASSKRVLATSACPNAFRSVAEDPGLNGWLKPQDRGTYFNAMKDFIVIIIIITFFFL